MIRNERKFILWMKTEIEAIEEWVNIKNANVLREMEGKKKTRQKNQEYRDKNNYRKWNIEYRQYRDKKRPYRDPKQGAELILNMIIQKNKLSWNS